VQKESKLRHLSSGPLRAIVDGVRTTPASELLITLRKETNEAILNASRANRAPSSRSKSSSEQLRRLHFERSLSGDRFSAKTTDFLQPRGPPLARPKSMGELQLGSGAGAAPGCDTGGLHSSEHSHSQWVHFD
jgi:hypothetical protein